MIITAFYVFQFALTITNQTVYSLQEYSKPESTNQRMWCEDFLSVYRNASIDHIMSKYYDRLSVFVEVTGDGRWTEPVTGAHKITVRLAALNASGGCGWPVVTCQRMRFDGLIVVLAADEGYQRQILIVHWRKASRRAVVSNHIYLITATNDVGGGDGSWVSSFYSRFEEWTRQLDRGSLIRLKTALYTGLTVVRNYYSKMPEHAADRADRNLYHRAARFSYTGVDGGGGGRVYIGPRAIYKQCGRLALDYRYVKLRAVETCWSGYSRYIPGTTVALTVGVLPKTAGPPGLADLEFVQLFVIDVRTRKILNDVLCFEPHRDGPKSSLSSSYVSSSTSLLSSSSLSSLSSTPSQQPSLSSKLSNPFFSVYYSSSSSGSKSSSSNKIDVRLPTMSTGVSNDGDLGELAILRSRVMANTLGIRYAVIFSGCTTSSSAGHQNQQNVTSSKPNPRQLFIGCVPLHVKYGQLKLLFERFGEVTYVKVYDGYNKQTGAKMLHNYAFLFFKDEKSVESAIAASPIPLDSNCNLNVSRPHHHTTTVGSDR